MHPSHWIAGPGYTLAWFALAAGLAYAIAGITGMIIIGILEGAFWASLQYLKDRRDRRVDQRARMGP